MKFLIVLLVVVLLVCGLFYFQGQKSAQLTAPKVAGGKLPQCGSKPNCVCSEQSPSDAHFIEPIALNSNSISSVAQAMESLGGVVVESSDNTLHATFTSKLFKFVDDVIVRIDGEQIHIRSSSRVGHSDMGVNKKRVELLREQLN